MRFLALALVATLTACGSDSTAPSNPASGSIAGSWTLRTINGSPLPYTIQNGTSKANFTNSTLTITDGGTWAETGAFTLSVNGGAAQPQVVAANGSYQRAGSIITLYTTTSTMTAFYLACQFDGKNGLACSASGTAYGYTR